MEMQPDTEQAAVASDTADTITIAGIALIAYILASVLHEGVGHGGACLATGGKPIMVSMTGSPIEPAMKSSDLSRQ